jgi:starch synthase (maltosyl-transferring)
MYSGYEIYENHPVEPSSEEYLNSEKYQLRPRDFAGALAEGRSLQPLITKLNAIRRRHPAFQQLKGLYFHGISNENLLCYSRRHEDSGDTVIVVVCLDPQSQQWAETDLWMPALGLHWPDVVEVVDELSGEVYQWGQRNAVGLDPHWRAAHVLSIRKPI